MSDNSMTMQKPTFAHQVKKVLNSIKRYFSRPENIITVAFAIFLTAAVIYPLVRMVLSSFLVQSSGEATALKEEFDVSIKRGDFTFLYWPY